jgi:hypothetical protein
MREMLREKAKRMLISYLFGAFVIIVSFFLLGRFVIEPMLTPGPAEGECPIGAITNTTCNDRGFCDDGYAVCNCTWNQASA